MIGGGRSFLVHDDSTEDLSELTEKQLQDRDKRKMETRNAVAGYDLGAPWVRRWRKMPPEARAAACVAALFASFELDTRLFYYDERARVAFAVQPDPNVKGRQKGIGRSVGRTVEEVLAPAIAAFGTRAVAIRQFIKQRGHDAD